MESDRGRLYPAVGCRFLCGEICAIASRMSGYQVKTRDDACKACMANKVPQAPNDVTASLAMSEMHRQGCVNAKNIDYVKGLLHKEDRRSDVHPDGPGTELKRLISWFRPKKTAKCSKCSDRALRMNRWGPEECLKKKKTIVNWLRESAKEEGLPFSEIAAGILVDFAIKRSSKSSKPRVREPEVLDKHGWAIAVTTAPRKQSTLAMCLASIKACGWEPIVFAEPGADLTDCYTVYNHTRLGVWHNWLNSARWCLENTSASIVMTVQDDSLFHPDSRSFVESALWPCRSTGFVSLYTPKHYTLCKSGLRPAGVNRIKTRSLWGACALVWDRRVLEAVVSHPIAKKWSGARPRSGNKDVIQRRLDNPHTIANSDTAIGKILNAMKRTMWFVDPSPVQHIAKYSTISHGDNSGRRNAWRIASYDMPLFEQIPAPAIKYSIDI